jgi:quinol monooxygenase YgiN
MPKQAVVVRYKVEPGKMEEFLARLRRHIANTKAKEPGCLQFDILFPHDSKGDVLHLHEVYADEAALRLHNTSEWLAQYKAETEGMLSERMIIWCTVEE